MTVLWNDRSKPLALNSAMTAISAGIRLAYDFTGHDAPRTAGVPWLYQGATSPTMVLTGTMTQATVVEPGAVATAASLWQYNSSFSNTVDYGLQLGTGDFTIAVRISTPAALPTTSQSRELFQIKGSAGTALTVNMLGNPGAGFYVVATGSTCCPLGATNGTPTYFPADTVIMVYVRKAGGITTIFTQNATTASNTVVRYVAGAAATTAFDSTWAASLRLNYAANANTTGLAMQAFTVWNVGHSQATLDTIGKDYYATQANTAVADSISITSPASGSTIAATSVVEGTITGTPPVAIDVQHGTAGWVPVTGLSIAGNSWSGSVALTAAAAASLQARYANNTAIVSTAVANITVASNSITFTGNGLTLNEVVAFRTFPLKGSNQVNVVVKFNYTGSPTGFQYSYDGGAWAALGGVPSGGAHQGAITLPGPSQGPLSVRFTNNTSVVATMAAVGVGRGMNTAGQSQHVGGGAGTYVPPVAPAGHPAWKATILDKTGVWRENVETALDPFSKVTNASFNSAASATYPVQASSATATNSYFGRLATMFMAAGTPIAFVPSAMGSTTMEAWAPSSSTATLFGAMAARAAATGIVDVTMWQGEANCGNGTTRATHETNLNGFVNGWAALFPDAEIYLMNINATGNSVGSGGTGATDTGFAAIHAAIANVAATNPNVSGYADMNGAFSSGLHYSTAPEINTIAQRAYDGIVGTVLPATSVTLSLKSRAGANRASLTGLKWAFFDQMPGAFAAPTAQGTAEVTDSSGVVVLNITGTALIPSAVGWLNITNSNGTVNTNDFTFAGPVQVA